MRSKRPSRWRTTTPPLVAIHSRWWPSTFSPLMRGDGSTASPSRAKPLPVQRASPPLLPTHSTPSGVTAR